MIAYAPRAARQVRDLRQHYEDRNRVEAVRRLMGALDEAADKIERNPTLGLPAPRPYPGLAKTGRVWIKLGRYWIVYSTITFPVIIGVFYETADISNRL